MEIKFSKDGVIKSNASALVFQGYKDLGKGIRIVLKTNSIFGGGGLTYFVPNVTADDVPLDATMYKFTDAKGEIHIINLADIKCIDEVRLTEVEENRCEWNGKWVEECRYRDVRDVRKSVWVTEVGFEPSVVLGNAHGKFFTDEWGKGYEK